jgi:hypothetical protein
LNNGGYDPQTPGSDIITISFASPTSAFGFSWGAADLVWNLSAYDTAGNLLEAHDLPLYSDDTHHFYGIAHSGVSSLVLTCTHLDQTGWLDVSPDIIFIDYPGASNVVPLPGAVWLLGSGLLGLAGLRRIKKG